MKKSSLILFFFCYVLLFFACTKDEIDVYNSDSCISFNRNVMRISRDTIDVQFGFIKADTITKEIQFLLTGYAESRDRMIQINANTYDDEVFLLPNQWILPKDSVRVSIPISIVRKAINGQEHQLLLRINNGTDLKKGLVDSLFISTNDVIPSKWIGDEDWYYGSVEQYLGPCTRAKYLFIYKTFEVWDFSAWSYYGMMANAATFNSAIRILKNMIEKEGPIEDVEDPTGYITFP